MDRRRFDGKGEMKKIKLLEYATGFAAEEPKHLQNNKISRRISRREQNATSIIMSKYDCTIKARCRKTCIGKVISKYR